MHLVIAHAGASTAALRGALAGLPLPHLAGLLARLEAGERDTDAETSLSPPHERAEARALGLEVADGLFPWAARLAGEAGFDPEPGARAWGLLTPVHLHLGTEQVSLLDPAALALPEAQSRVLHEAVGELFTTEGFRVAWCSPMAWLVSHDSLASLPTASLDRVIHRNIDRWLPDTGAARLLKRLQNEVQMLLYQHPANDEREAAGLPSVNSVWLSGCGRWPAGVPWSRPDLAVDRSLSGPALADDAEAWRAAWAALDQGLIASLARAAGQGDDIALTLCGETAAQTWHTGPRGLWQRITAFGRKPVVVDVLTGL